MENKSIRARAELVDHCLEELEEALVEYADACRKIDREYRDAQKDQPPGPYGPKTIRLHPHYSEPLRHLKAALPPTIRKALRIMPSKRKALVEQLLSLEKKDN